MNTKNRRTGHVSFGQGSNDEITDAVVSTERIALDLSTDADGKWAVVLKPVGGAWVGNATNLGNATNRTARVEARLYTAENGGFALVGEWHEGSDDFEWFVEVP